MSNGPNQQSRIQKFHQAILKKVTSDGILRTSDLIQAVRDHASRSKRERNRDRL